MAGASAHRPSVAPTSKVGCIADFQIREPGIVQVALEFCCVADLEIGDTAGLETCYSAVATLNTYPPATSKMPVPPSSRLFEPFQNHPFARVVEDDSEPAEHFHADVPGETVIHR